MTGLKSVRLTRMRMKPHEVKWRWIWLHTQPKQKNHRSAIKRSQHTTYLCRRWFQSNIRHDVQPFSVMYALNYAVSGMKTGKKATNAALDSGYRLFEWFSAHFKKLTRHSPTLNLENAVI